MSELRLGKRPATHDPRDLQYAHLRDETVKIRVPAHFGHYRAVQQWQMLGNGPDDSVAPGFGGAGDCVFAGGDHETMLWTAEGGNPATFTGKQAIADYSAVAGYVLNDPNTDQGTNVRDALNYRRQTGLIDANGHRHQLGAYVALEPGNYDQLMEACYLFSAVGIGIEFPSSAMGQFDAGKPWTVVAGAQVEGGHYVPVMGRTSATYIEVVTWARVQKMSRAFYEKYCDEAWALLSPELLSGGKSPEGFSLAQLQADLANL